MATSHGSNADFVGNGYVLSEFLNTASFSGSRDTAESTTFKKKSKTYIPGLKDTTMTAEGIYDGDTDAVDQILHAALINNVTGLFSYIPEGQEKVGSRAYSMDAIETSYEVTSDVGDINQISAEFNAGTAGRFMKGQVAKPMGSVTGVGSSEQVDLVSTNSKGIGLVVHAVTSVDLILRLQHATASSGPFADLPGSIEFSSGRGSQRLWIPSQTVNRYAKVAWSGSGTFMAIIERSA